MKLTNKTRLGMRAVFVFLLVVAVGLAYIEVHHRLTYGHFVPLGLHADIVVHNTPIGIPGITKMYEGTLTNYGLLPSRVERCTYISDTMSPGAMVAFNIEKWEAAKREWVRVLEFATPELCSPIPTSMGNTKWVRSWLWPGQMLSTGTEATAARGFLRGDILRFAIITDVTGKDSRSPSYRTPSFTLDEQSLDTETGYRVRH